MPTYAYACSSCSHAFDIYQSFSDDALTVCPSCNEPTLRKQFSAVGVVFKGSGFYRNDSRSGSERSGSTKSSSSSSGSSGSSESGSSGSSSSGSSSSGSSSEKSSSSSTPAKAASTSS
ncbi:FmdB family transcriptional regulator [Ruania alkalisoli]|uniref:FmdB family transcriptional regulator n=1 Tax=Ruania alkalisoli TaxID=2779775 RepID=A0A7M1SXT1_9MICO|nr:FmdB family zinc ribbon protein [Ruania alkalisoli]QOR71532.1 FmdB family transcriptional regulator [Ruania alkalisoli]